MEWINTTMQCLKMTNLTLYIIAKQEIAGFYIKVFENGSKLKIWIFSLLLFLKTFLSEPFWKKHFGKNGFQWFYDLDLDLDLDRDLDRDMDAFLVFGDFLSTIFTSSPSYFRTRLNNIIFKPAKNSIRTADLYSSWFVTDNDLNPSTKGADLNHHRFKISLNHRYLG